MNCDSDGCDPSHYVIAVVVPRFDAIPHSNRDARRRQETPEIVEFALETLPAPVILVALEKQPSSIILVSLQVVIDLGELSLEGAWIAGRPFVGLLVDLRGDKCRSQSLGRRPHCESKIRLTSSPLSTAFFNISSRSSTKSKSAELRHRP